MNQQQASATAETANSPAASVTKIWIRALEQTKAAVQRPYGGFALPLDELAALHGSATALLSAETTLSYAGLAEAANRYARWAMRAGLMPGDVVCLLMPNHPDYLAIWLGLTRIGAIVALINTNLTGSGLVHCINAVSPKYMIVAAELLDCLPAALFLSIECWVHGPSTSFYPRIDLAIEELSGAAISRRLRPPPSPRDPALYIYTSGTTGLPKAAKVSHLRLVQWSHWFAGMMGTGPDDRMYNCLPMYHGVGGVVATGAVLVNGGSVLLQRRFSGSQFWQDIRMFDCTLFQYIGELCRYLVNSPAVADEGAHRLRLCCGNGLRPGVWEAFKQRFRIPRILEFYASTEGTFSLYNCEEKVGAIGRIPKFLAHRTPVMLVRHDPDTNEPVRDAAGACIPCKADETGEAIGEVVKDGAGFEGYTDRAASERKLLRGVRLKGDMWFRTGDLMRRDQQGYFYFVDRVGDTFRWKGENVSTTEVAAVIMGFPGVSDAAVYGVSIPGADGRAGMAAIAADTRFDLSRFRCYLAEHLPDYARPVFLRLATAIETTATFKPRKQALIEAGFDPGRCPGPIHIDDKVQGAYAMMDDAVYQRVVSGQIRL